MGVEPIVLCILLALLQTSLQNLGLGVQKAGVGWMQASQWDRARIRLLVIWVGGILLCISGIVSQAFALEHGPASLVAVLGPFGLIPLYLFCRVVLHEPLTKAHWAALAIIMTGTAYVGYTSHQGPSEETLSLVALTLGAVVALAVPGLFVMWAFHSQSPFLALGLGSLAGTCNGLALLILNCHDHQSASSWVVGAFWLLASAAGFAAIQWAYHHGDAVQVVPSNVAMTVVVPVLIAPFAFSDTISLALVAGMLTVLTGLVLLGLGERSIRDQHNPSALA